MSARAIVFFVGIFIILLPFAGLPQSWDRLFLVGCGILLVITAGFTLYQRTRNQGQTTEVAEEQPDAASVFVESPVPTYQSAYATPEVEPLPARTARNRATAIPTIIAETPVDMDTSMVRENPEEVVPASPAPKKRAVRKRQAAKAAVRRPAKRKRIASVRSKELDADTVEDADD